MIQLNSWLWKNVTSNGDLSVGSDLREIQKLAIIQCFLYTTAEIMIAAMLLFLSQVFKCSRNVGRPWWNLDNEHIHMSMFGFCSTLNWELEVQMETLKLPAMPSALAKPKMQPCYMQNHCYSVAIMSAHWCPMRKNFSQIHFKNSSNKMGDIPSKTEVSFLYWHVQCSSLHLCLCNVIYRDVLSKSIPSISQ